MAVDIGGKSDPIKARRKRRVFIFVVVSLLALGFYGLIIFGLAWNTVCPKPSKMRTNPTEHGMSYENATFNSFDATLLSGWLCLPAQPKAVVILCHGVDGNRASMIPKAKLLYAAGFGVLLFDFRTRGESGGRLCTIGKLETDDLISAVKWVQSHPKTASLKIGVLGDSMGASVSIMGAARCVSILAVVAESPFDRLDHAVANHFSMLFGKASPILEVPVQWVGEKLIGSKATAISPIDEIAHISPRPILIIADQEDDLCRKEEIEGLFTKAGLPKSLWSVPKADHIEAYDVAKEEYESRVIHFFNQSLK